MVLPCWGISCPLAIRCMSAALDYLYSLQPSELLFTSWFPVQGLPSPRWSGPHSFLEAPSIAGSPWGSGLGCLQVFPMGDLINSENSWVSASELCVGQVQECTGGQGATAILQLVVHGPVRVKKGRWHVFCIFGPSPHGKTAQGVPASPLLAFMIWFLCLAYQDVFMPIAWFYLGWKQSQWGQIHVVPLGMWAWPLKVYSICSQAVVHVP